MVARRLPARGLAAKPTQIMAQAAAFADGAAGRTYRRRTKVCGRSGLANTVESREVHAMRLRFRTYNAFQPILPVMLRGLGEPGHDCATPPWLSPLCAQASMITFSALVLAACAKVS